MESDWSRFFVLAGIPDGIAARYAKVFAANRIAKEQVTDLDKATLVELGITAIGDQLAILKRVKIVAMMKEKKAAAAPTAPSAASTRAPISAPSANDDRFTALDDRCASVQRRGKPPPDRHEIYHVKMPAGNTAKTRKILQNLEALKRSGIHSRGTSGVRKAGRAVLSIAEQREREMEVSSTTGGRVGGLHVDRLAGVRGLTGRVVKRRVGAPAASSGGLFGAAIAAAGTAAAPARKRPLRVERAEGAGGRLPQVTVQLGNRVRVVGGGAGEKKVVVSGGGGGARGAGLAGRVQGGRVQRQQGVVVQYEDGEEELMEDEEIYEDEEEVEYEDAEAEGEEYEEEMEEEEEEDTLIVGPSSLATTSRTHTRYVPVQRGQVRQQQPLAVRVQHVQQQQQRRGPLVVQQRRAPLVVQRPASSIFDRIQFSS